MLQLGLDRPLPGAGSTTVGLWGVCVVQHVLPLVGHSNIHPVQCLQCCDEAEGAPDPLVLHHCLPGVLELAEVLCDIVDVHFLLLGPDHLRLLPGLVVTPPIYLIDVEAPANGL